MAEISGGKHRFSVRFMGFDKRIEQRPEQVYEDIPFDLAICVMYASPFIKGGLRGIFLSCTELFRWRPSSCLGA